MKAIDESIDNTSRRDALQRVGVGIAAAPALLAAGTAAAQGLRPQPRRRDRAASPIRVSSFRSRRFRRSSNPAPAWRVG